MSLNEIFLLHLNLRFASLASYERVQPILCVCLASLNPMTMLEMYHSVNALRYRPIALQGVVNATPWKRCVPQ